MPGRVLSLVSCFIIWVLRNVHVNDSVPKRHVTAADLALAMGLSCPKLHGQMEHCVVWWGQWRSCSCCRLAMVTIQELIDSTGLPDGSRQRLWKVMQAYGYT